MSRALAALCAAALAGCFDSLVSSPCAAGYRYAQGQCMPEDIGDGGPVLVCEQPLLACGDQCRDLSADPDHCGQCGRACPSGICVASRCEGGLPSHVVAIGHDYRRHNGAMARVLGNAVALGAPTELAVGRLGGVAAANDGVTRALASALAAIGRPWRAIALPPASATALDGVDVLLVESQGGTAAAAMALGAAWAAAVDRLLTRGGVVVALHGAGGQTHAFAQAAGLYAVPAPVAVVGALAAVVAPADAVTQAVVSPYLAEDGSATFPSAPPAVIATAAGQTLVFHLTRE